MKKYTVSGPFEVAGVAPGNEVTEQQLVQTGAIISMLVETGHLVEQVKPTEVAPKKKDM